LNEVTMLRRAGILCLFPLISLVAAVSAQAREGFGFTKRAVQMTLTRPPAVNVTGARLRVTAVSARSDGGSDAQSLQKLVAEAIVAGDARIAESEAPDLDIHLTLEHLDAGDSWETKTDYEYQQTGTKDEWNASRGKYEKKAVFGNVPVTKHIKVVQGALTGAFEICDAKGHVLDAGPIDRKFKRKYDGSDEAPPRETVMTGLLHDAAESVAARIVPTQERVTVILPKGSFEPFIPLAEEGKWEEYLTAVTAVPEMHSRDQEAYRQYALALAKEGLAYGTSDRLKAAKLLDEALQHYRTAIAGNPEESLFREPHVSLFGTDAGLPLPRIEASVKAYGAWNRRVKGEE
jgi:hypothetical protein